MRPWENDDQQSKEDAHVYDVHEAETTIITTNIKKNNNEKFSLLAIKKTEPENIGHE